MQTVDLARILIPILEKHAEVSKISNIKFFCREYENPKSSDAIGVVILRNTDIVADVMILLDIDSSTKTLTLNIEDYRRACIPDSLTHNICQAIATVSHLKVVLNDFTPKMFSHQSEEGIKYMTWLFTNISCLNLSTPREDVKAVKVTSTEVK
jgi:hypothetical protein